MSPGLIFRYSMLHEKIPDRKKQYESFTHYLEEKTTWLKSPASTQYQLSEECGLLKHSVGVAENLLKFRSFLALGISEGSCVVVGLSHDVGKLRMPDKPLYINNDENLLRMGKAVKYKHNPEVTVMGLAVRSLYIISQHITLFDEEAQSIAYHDGQYIDDNRIVRTKNHH